MCRKLFFSISLALVLALSVQANLLLNPGFENGATGWFGDTPIPDWNIWGTSGWHHNDVGYIRDTKAVKEWWDDAGIQQDFAVTEEDSYTFSVWAISASSDFGGLGGWDGVFKVQWYDSNWSEISSEEIGRFYGYRPAGNYPNPGDPVDVWKFISGVKTAPAGAVNGRVVLILVDGDLEYPWPSEHKGSINWDDVSVIFGGDAAIAWNPIPLNEANNVSQAVVLTWSAGDYADEHDVYFGTDFNEVNDANASCLASDVDCNGQVNLADLLVLAEQWLGQPPGGSEPSADLNDDDIVNLIDFAIIADDWMERTVYKGNRDTTSYEPSGLEEGVTYYWRIDEVNDSNSSSPWRGTLWSFTVISIEDLLAEMTLEEKVEQLGGGQELMTTPDNDRLGIPGFKMADGPHGVREWGSATSFPGALALGATWDTALVQRVGEALGREFRGKGRYVALCPCINIIRDPRGGRSFETMGEDPYLVGQLASEYVKGVQSQKVISVVKHFACNNQENNRGTNNVIVNERTLREIYLPAFKMCVQDADTLGIMSAYNKVNGPYCSENPHLLTDILKDEWGFEGFVVSDWGACHSTIESANAGLDVEMPYAYYFGQSLIDAVNSGYVLEDTIDDAVRRILWTKSWAGVFERPATMNESAINTPQHQALTLEAAKKAIVLLKNTAAQLPIDKTKISSIAVIGPNADIARHCGGGSCYVTPYYKVSPLEGIQSELAGTGIAVNFSQGCYIDSGDLLYPIQSSFLKPPGGSLGEGLQGEYFTNKDLSGSPALTRNDAPVDFDWGGGSPGTPIGTDDFSVRWTGKLVPTETGQYTLGTKTDDGVRLYLDSVLLIDDWYDHAVKTNSVTISLNAGQEYDVKMEYYENAGDAVAKLCWTEPSFTEQVMIDQAASVAADADVAIVVVGTTPQIETEGHDRPHLDLPGQQDELIQAVSEANPNTVVLVVSGSAVLMDDWIDDVPAVLECWFNGQETGNAIAAVLFGEHNPAGRLPVTFPLNEAQMPAFDNNYEAAGQGPGYRYYDRNQIEPLFVFGHGLSYTEFEYTNLQISPEKVWSGSNATVSVDVENVGGRVGDEVVQLYIHDVNASVVRPIKELKGFKKIGLEPTQKETVTFTLPAKELAFYDVNQGKFVVEGGEFEVMIGSSSADIKVEGSFEVVSIAWDQVPTTTGPNSISMTAVISDPNSCNTAEYYFECTAGGGNDSGWQNSTTYEDTGLQIEMLYTYRVKARDKNAPQNQTDWSSEESATTEDNTAPTPNPATWATVPHKTGARSISMTATTASDINGAEYYFECTAGGGNDSCWQDDTTYEDTGLNPLTQYTYRLKARDKSPSQNQTGWSSDESTTTAQDPAVFLVAHWKLDETEGTTASDSSDNDNDGTLIGNPIWADGALLFDGNGDYISVPNEPFFDITDEITVTAWIKVNAFDKNFNTIIAKGDYAWRLARANNTDSIEFACTGISNNDWGYISGSVNVNDGQWHHVAGVYDGSKIYLYVDGVEDTSENASGSINNIDYPVYIGENAEETGRYWNGLINDVRVYDRALLPGDINDIYQGL